MMAHVLDLGLPLTPQQKHLLGAHAHGWQWAWLSVPGIDADTLHQRLMALLSRHDALRLRYVRPSGATGLRQTVIDVAQLDVDWRVVNQVDGDAQACQRRAIDYLKERGQRPDAVAWLFADQLLLAVPLCSLDLRSLGQLRRELLEPGIPSAETMQYGQYSEWVNGLQLDEDAAQGTQFWRNLNLQHRQGLRLPERYGQASGSREALGLPLPRGTAIALQQLAGQQGLRLEHLALAAWAALLARLNGQQEGQLALQHDPRDDYEELQGAYGLFEQPLPMLMQLSAQSSWLSLARQFARQLESAVDWQEYAAQAQLLPDWRASLQTGVRVLTLSPAVQALSFDSPMELLLQWTLDEASEGHVSLIHDSGLYRRPQMALLLQRYLAWLDNLLANPDAPLEQVPALLADDPVALQAIAPNVEEVDLIGALRRHAQRDPARAALRDGGWRLSYAELDRLSDIVAGHLHRAGAGPETIVGLYLPRTAHMLIAMLACFKAGAAYLPLDPQQPPLRLLDILHDAQPCLLLHLDDRLPNSDLPTLAWSRISQGEPWTQQLPAEPDQLAYVLHTSGTSGKPKGVQIEHGQLRHYVSQITEALQLPVAGHYGLVSSLLADLGNTVLYPAWLQGGCVHLLAQDCVTDAQAFADELSRHPLDVLKIVPSHLEALMGERSPATVLPRQALVLGGEAISERLAAKLAEAPTECRLYNHYGPTETTVGVLWRRFDARQGCLGTALDRVIGNNRIYLLDAHGQPVPSGQVGELYIAGASVGRGYIGGVESEAFSQDPFTGARRYRTGDLAVRQADGALRLLGRNDQQVKIRGFRLELGEVEYALCALPGVQQAAVLCDGNGEHARLLGFVVEEHGAQESSEQRLKRLAETLPDYMRPAMLLSLKSLPLNANGKLDRAALLERTRQHLHSARVAPSGALEHSLLAIWRQVLDVEELGVTDNFFAVGGHSLAAIKVVSLIRERLGLTPPTHLLFEYQTVRELAAQLDDSSAGRWRRLSPAPATAPVLLLVHGAQGHLAAYRPLIDGLAGTIEVFGLAAREQDWQDDTALDLLLDRYAESLAPELKSRPLHLLGWSLASRLAALLVPRLQARGFRIEALLVVDHDPSRSLAGEGDESGQLLADLAFFSRSRQRPLAQTLLARLSTSLNGCTYSEGVERLLADKTVRQHLDWQGEAAPLKAHLNQYRRIKTALYRQTLPTLEVPVWLWRGNGHGDLRDAWQALTSRAVNSHNIDAGHHELLANPHVLHSVRATLVEATS